MTKILFLADLGHASPRVPELALALQELGLQINIIAPRMTKYQKKLFGVDNLDKIGIFETKFRTTYKIDIINNLFLSLFWKIYRFLCDRKRSSSFYYKKFEKEVIAIILQNKLLEPRTILVTSSSPFEMHEIGKSLQERFECKWIADYRDLWSNNYVSPKGHTEKKIEQKTLSKCDAIMTVSEGLQMQLMELHKSPTFVVRNGFRVPITKFIDKRNDDLVHIRYLGQIYQNFQEYLIFRESLQVLIAKCPERLRIEIFCPNVKSAEKILNLGFVKQIPQIKLFRYVSRDEAIKLQINSKILVVFDWRNPKQKGVVPTKFMEYLGSGNFIVVFGRNPESEMAQILSKTKAGQYIQKSEEFIQLIERYLSEQEDLIIRPNKEELTKFSWGNQATVFSNIVSKI